jgi:hypothetical protein
MKSTAIDDLRNGARCKCCTSPADYYLLLKLRKEEEEMTARSTLEDTQEKQNLEDDRLEEENEDDDFDLDCYTDYEVTAMEEMKSRSLAYERAKLMGYGALLEQSASHLERMFSTFELIILHIYNPKSEFQARINLYLEKLATMYMGTIFRRLEVGSTASLLVTVLQGSPVRLRKSEFSSDWCGGIIAIRRCTTVAWTSQLEVFGSDDELLSTELDAWLGHANVLSRNIDQSLSLEVLQQIANQTGSDDEGDQDLELDCEAYCDLPGCGRNFPHEHVGGSGGLGTLSANADKAGVFNLGQLGKV